MLKLDAPNLLVLDPVTALLRHIASVKRIKIDHHTTTISGPTPNGNGTVTVTLRGSTSLTYTYTPLNLNRVMGASSLKEIVITGPVRLKDVLRDFRVKYGINLTTNEVVDYRILPTDEHVRLVTRSSSLRFTGTAYIKLIYKPGQGLPPLSGKPLNQRDISNNRKSPVLVPTDEYDHTTRDVVDVLGKSTHLKLKANQVVDKPLVRGTSRIDLEDNTPLKGHLHVQVVRGKVDTRPDLTNLIATTRFREFPLITGTLESGSVKSLLLKLVNSKNGTRFTPIDLAFLTPKVIKNSTFNTELTIVANPDGVYRGEVTIFYNRVEYAKVVLPEGVTLKDPDYYWVKPL